MNTRDYLNYGITNFDNLGTSLLTVFQMITSETWYQQLINLMDVDFPVIGVLYCFLVIIVGQFFLLNLILAVIIQAFMKSHEKKLQEDIKQLEELNEVDSSQEELEEEEYDNELFDEEEEGEAEIDEQESDDQ